MSTGNPSVDTRNQAAQQRPINLNPIELGLKLPAAGVVSLLHRVSGIILFLSIPLVIFILDISLRSEVAFADAYRFMGYPIVKIICFILVWAIAHHVVAGIRFLLLDMHWGLDKPYPKLTAYATLAISIVFTIIVGVKLW